MNSKHSAPALPADAIYEASLKPDRSTVRRFLLWIWTVAGLAGLIWLAWAEPFSAILFDSMRAAGTPAWLVDFVLTPAVMALRAVLLVESAGYAFHRFMQHVGWFTRRAQFFRRNQRFHWIHHMVLYPIGRFYKRASDYISSEKGLGLSWFIPALVICTLFVVHNGFNLGSLAFLVGFALYAKYVVDETHSRFHMTSHSWQGKPYFVWLEEIHLLHHWDQRYNFTICHPLMDIVFGTYLSPAKHQAELAQCLEDKALTVSDLINWRYLIKEATPIEYAAFISAARRNPRALRKIGLLRDLLAERTAAHPEDAQARELHQKTLDLLVVLGQPAA